VDAAIAYECPHKAKTIILLLRNALYIEELEINLLPPFIVREAGIQINECPKFQAIDATNENYSMLLEEPNIRIPFQLNGTFSYFETR